MFYKRLPTAHSSRQNAASPISCRCCFWDFEWQIPVRFWSTRTEKQATSDREKKIRLLPARVYCYRFRLVLLWYSTGESVPDGMLVFVRFCWSRINGQRGMVRRRAEWVSKSSYVNMFCFDGRVCTVSKWCSSEAAVNICLSDWNRRCISTTQSVTGWSNDVASFGSKYRACSIWTLKCFGLSCQSNVTKLSWFVYFEKMKTFHGSVVLLKTCGSGVNACCNSYDWFVFSQKDA